MAMNKLREEMAAAFVSALEEEKIPWIKSWSVRGIPVNAINGNEYRGVNRMWLAYLAHENGYKDNRWCTFNQAKEKGYMIKKGAHGAKIEFWSWYDTLTKKKLSYSEFNETVAAIKDTGEKWDDRIKPISSIYVVFNAEQIEGIPEPEELKLPEKGELLDGRNRIIDKMELSFREDGDRAFYRPSDDSLHMPPYKNFKSEYAYMATFLHEAGHATGAEHRLNRNIKNTFGTSDYAREELRAEIASAFTAQILGIGSEAGVDNHKAYIQSWISILKNNPNELFAAIKDAEKISDYLIEKGEFLKDKSDVKCLAADEKKADPDMELTKKKNRKNKNASHEMERL